MRKRFRWLGAAAATTVAVGFVLRAVSVHSVGVKPEIYRIAVASNDLDAVDGLGLAGKTIELWYRQRNFKEGDTTGGDRFDWCAWKNHGTKIRIATTQVNPQGVFRFSGLRQLPTTVQVYPSGPGSDRCRGGLYTELRVRACDAPGVNCTTDAVPTLHWLNTKRLSPVRAAAAGSVSDAIQAAVAVADGPNDTATNDDQDDVDEHYANTTNPGLQPGQRLTWRCAGGGTFACPSITVHDPTTAFASDPEYGFVLATLQGHRPGGSILAASEIVRGEELGLQVNVDVTVRARVDINLGCDSPKAFGFKVPGL